MLTTPDGKAGLKAEYGEGRRGPDEKSQPLLTRTEANVNLTQGDLPKEVTGKKSFGVQWSGIPYSDRIR